VDVQYSCFFDRMDHNQEKLRPKELPDIIYFNDLSAAQRTQESVKLVSGAWLVANYTLHTIDDQSSQFDIARRIHTNATEFCPV
jgi:hypothetical protein